jgi:hypothetical protein
MDGSKDAQCDRNEHADRRGSSHGHRPYRGQPAGCQPPP